MVFLFINRGICRDLVHWLYCVYCLFCHNHVIECLDIYCSHHYLTQSNSHDFILLVSASCIGFCCGFCFKMNETFLFVFCLGISVRQKSWSLLACYKHDHWQNSSFFFFLEWFWCVLIYGLLIGNTLEWTWTRSFVCHWMCVSVCACVRVSVCACVHAYMHAIYPQLIISSWCDGRLKSNN